MKKKTRTVKAKKDSKKLLSIVGAVLLVLVGVTVAYAALSATLSITINKVTQSGMEWNVAFETGNVTATEGGTSATGRSCGTATATASTVTVADTTLSKPGDSCTYALTIKNTGGIDATLATITPNQPTGATCTTSGASMVCGAQNKELTYKLTTDAAGTTLLTTGGPVLAAQTGTLPVYLVIEYTGTQTNSTAVEQTSGGFTLVYNQA